MMADILQFWRRLSIREQWLVGGGVALLLVVVLIFYVWQPMEKQRLKLRAAMPQLKREAQRLRAEADEVAKLRQLRDKDAQIGDLRGVIEQSAVAHGLSIGQVVPQPGGKFQISLPSVSFDAWLKWVGEMQARHHAGLESCRIEALPQAGLVKVQLVLVKG